MANYCESLEKMSGAKFLKFWPDAHGNIPPVYAGKLPSLPTRDSIYILAEPVAPERSTAIKDAMENGLIDLQHAPAPNIETIDVGGGKVGLLIEGADLRLSFAEADVDSHENTSSPLEAAHARLGGNQTGGNGGLGFRQRSRRPTTPIRSK